MKSIVNKAHVEGVVYEHKLQAKVTGENSKNPGTEYITGEIRVQTTLYQFILHILQLQLRLVRKMQLIQFLRRLSMVYFLLRWMAVTQWLRLMVRLE